MITNINQNIAAAKAYLSQGEVVAIPTETVYGLAANAWQMEAVLRIFEVKQRPFFDPLILHVADTEGVRQCAQSIPQAAYDLFARFSPGPLTVLLPKSAAVSDLVTAGLETVAIRIPRHDLTQSLLRACGFPLAAPSANPFGYISPTSAQHVYDQLNGKIPMILDGGICGVGVESTIVGFDNQQLIVYRLGGLAIEDLQKVVPKIVLNINKSSNPKAPGQLKSHYAPRKKMFLGDLKTLFNALSNQHEKIGVLAFQAISPEVGESTPPQYQRILSPNGSLSEAAMSLFAAMRSLDATDVSVIIAEPAPDYSLGRAINDRLKRACA